MRPSEGPLVTAGEARAAATRALAGRWHYVRERWHGAAVPPHLRGTPPPDRYHWPERFTLREIAALGRVRLEGQRY